MGAREEIEAVALLNEPARKRLYDYVVGQVRAVDRNQVASALDMPRATAAFHLDKLAEAGLLDVEFARRDGRTGPGAGRPTKWYRRAAQSIAVQLPERAYEIAGTLLAQAVDDTERSGGSPSAHLRSRAVRLGHDIADTLDDEDTLEDGLTKCGYEPKRCDDETVLVNCPFHALVADHRQLVCGMNLGLITGMLDELGDTERRARLEPHDGFCCVRIGSGEGLQGEPEGQAS